MRKIIFIVILLISSSVGASNFGMSVIGQNDVITLEHSISCDSATAAFYINGVGVDSLVLDTTITLLPHVSGSGGLLLSSQGQFDLDSSGMYSVIYTYYETSDLGTASGYTDGIWWNREAPLTVASNIGINFDDISGTLDAAEIGTDAITAAKIAPSAIGASEIATAALDNDAFAVNAISVEKIADGAITSAKAPNLDAAVSSRSSHMATAIVSAGAITTLSGAVTTVTNVGTVSGNVTGNIGGNVVGSVASVTADVSITDVDMGLIADSNQVVMEQDDGYLHNLVSFWGAGIGMTKKFYPVDGTSPKDSAVCYDSLGTALMVIHFRNPNVSTVLDSTNVESR